MGRCGAVMLALLLVACGRGGEDPPPSANAATASAAPAADEVLAGLYEGPGTGLRRNRMCIVPGAGAQPRFGLVVWGQGDTSCTMTGEARRSRSGLRLEADPECAFEVQLQGATITLRALPQGCAYYCGPSASLDGARFDKVTDGDPRQAVDLMGDPLCR